jgi:hypothetical protein
MMYEEYTKIKENENLIFGDDFKTLIIFKNETLNL